MMNMDYISVIDNFVDTVSTPILVIDDRSHVISSNKAAVDLLGNDFKDRHFYVAIRQPLIINLVENAFTAKGNEKENFYHIYTNDLDNKRAAIFSFDKDSLDLKKWEKIESNLTMWQDESTRLNTIQYNAA